MRLLLLGNSGSGKTTLATALADRYGLAMLDLDRIVWEPGRVAVQRPEGVARRLLEDFVSTHERWVVEGCYGELIEAASPRCTHLVLLDPGREACLAHNRARPWEPHKYASPAEQDAMLDALQAWVAGYYARDDAWSHRAHLRIFDAFPGRKTRLEGPVDAERLDLRAPADADTHARAARAGG